jgi:hypothetical protein
MIRGRTFAVIAGGIRPKKRRSISHDMFGGKENEAGSLGLLPSR